jgi:aminomethyltransferase
MPWTYRTTLAAEQRTVREGVGLADVSQLCVMRVAGPEAVACLEALVPRRIEDMPVGTTRYTVVLSRFGRFADEALIMRLAADEFWVSHGCGTAQTQLARLADDREVTVALLEDLQVLSLQGPRARDVLASLVDPPIEAIPHLGHRHTVIAGHPVLLSRTGFTGEPGFEIYCPRDRVVDLWREFHHAGRAVDLMAYGYQALDLLRIEAGFMLYPVDFAGYSSLWEVGLGWLLRDKQTDFVGRSAVLAAEGQDLYRVAGIETPGKARLLSGTRLTVDGDEVGVVTSSAYSPAHDAVLSIARIRRAARVAAVQIESCTGQGPMARLVELPFRPRRTAFP